MGTSLGSAGSPCRFQRACEPPGEHGLPRSRSQRPSTRPMLELSLPQTPVRRSHAFTSSAAWPYRDFVGGAILEPCLRRGQQPRPRQRKGARQTPGQRRPGRKRKYLFGERDREIITRYYSDHGSNLPPGLAKRGGNLPPGLEKHLERNGTLPPGLQKRIDPCPEELERQLPPLPAEYRRAVIGAHVVILNRNTNVIVDIMKDVVR